MTRHEWRERSEDGELRYFRATMHGRTWTLQSRLKSDEGWTVHDPIPRADLETLRELVGRKYQRRRATFEELQQLDALLEEKP